MHFKYENLKNYAPSNIAYCASARLGVPLLFGANLFMNYHNSKSLENLTGYDKDGNFYIEEWKDVFGYESLYKISTFGRVKSLKKYGGTSERFMKPILNRGGYYTAHLGKNGIYKFCLIHRLIGLTFIPNPENKPKINHKDTVKTNICVWNLEWATQRENCIHYRMTQPKSSQYTGVNWDKKKKTWRAYISIKGKPYFLGYSDTEDGAYKIYLKALGEVNEGIFVREKKKTSSQYTGVYWSTQHQKWVASIEYKCKKYFVGYFTIEKDAYEAREKKKKELRGE